MSQSTETQIEALTKFRDRAKFSISNWQQRGLKPSSDEKSNFLNDFFDKCIDQMVDEIKNVQPPQLIRKILKSNLSLLNREEYSKEDSEFIYDLYYELAWIIGFNLGHDLNKWLFGERYKKLTDFKKASRTKKVKELLIQPCLECDIELQATIIKEVVESPENRWFIASCDNCKALNIIGTGSDVIKSNFINYESVDWPIKFYSVFEKAAERLKQLKNLKDK